MIDWNEVFIYDAAVPSGLRSKYQRGPRKAGEPVGWQREDGYWMVGYKGKNVLVHRILHEMFHGPIPEGWQVDHVNGDRTDNDLDNLRAVEPAVNQRNMRKSRANTSGTTGVSRIEVIGAGGKVYAYWYATWKNSDGTRGSDSFSVLRYGEESAKHMAIAKRAAVIERLNSEGFGYSERHGT